MSMYWDDRRPQILDFYLNVFGYFGVDFDIFGISGGFHAIRLEISYRMVGSRGQTDRFLAIS